MEYVVEMKHIRKEFPGVVANDDITLQVRPGEIHALLGENGAGKSTLMGVLFGLHHPDEGIIRIKGKEVRITNPNIANNLGIGMVHQHFKLVQTFTVTENIILGNEGSIILNRSEATKKIEALSERYGLNIDGNAKIEDISVGMQQRVEILKMLYRDADVLIFDEPTAVLTPQEIDELMEIMARLIGEGKSIILITHKLREIKAVAHRCTVIRRGRYVGTVDVANTTQEEMASMMVGREVVFKVDKAPAIPGDVVLDVRNLTVIGDRKTKALTNVSLQVRSGEIVGIAGVDGNGQTELVEAITGLRSVTSGDILLKGKSISSMPRRQRNELGIAHIPEDRHKHGLVLQFSVGENLVLKDYYRPPFSSRGFLNFDEIRSHGERIMELFDVRAGQGVDSAAFGLSGGNQQKAIVGREMDGNPELLLAVQPTRGLDVGAIEYIHRRLVEQRDRGKAVLLVSLELDELFNLSDRLVVFGAGQVVGTASIDEVDEAQVGLMMAGIERRDAS
ncbi:MAG: heme ABC transporter ATP-binding protein [Dethiosulfovibrio peptidovorans]|nr:MAG: heme ABC transporter ATP-binding protein [Dethiosulfovibrio peptidovorans]